MKTRLPSDHQRMHAYVYVLLLCSDHVTKIAVTPWASRLSKVIVWQIDRLRLKLYTKSTQLRGWSKMKHFGGSWSSMSAWRQHDDDNANIGCALHGVSPERTLSADHVFTGFFFSIGRWTRAEPIRTFFFAGRRQKSRPDRVLPGLTNEKERVSTVTATLSLFAAQFMPSRFRWRRSFSNLFAE